MPTDPAGVLRLGEVDFDEVAALLRLFGLSLQRSSDARPIPGSYWGDEEAGLKGDVLFARNDTPIHSILHETGHYLCLDESRRNSLDTDAGSDDDEENAVCYLQVLLADRIAGMGRARMFTDMDRWGYSFRLGSARAWFEQDAREALKWLVNKGVLQSDQDRQVRLRQC